MSWGSASRSRGVQSESSALKLYLDRSEHVRSVTRLLDRPLGGPLVVTGPEGSGKTSILNQVLGGRGHVIYINLHERPVNSGEDLLLSFCRNR